MAKIKLSKEAKMVLKILGKAYRENISSRTEGVLMKSLLARAGIYNPLNGTNFILSSNELQTYGLTTTIVNETAVARGTAQEVRMLLTEKGWDYLNPWYIKMWGWFKEPVKTIIVGLLAGAGGGIIVTLVSKWLGWIK